VDEHLERFNATAAARAIIRFVDDDVSNWYVRLGRSRFYDVDTPDGRGAFATLHEVLVSVCRLAAPFMPFVTDWIHRQLTGSSVHLAPFVPATPRPVDGLLDSAMRDIRELSRLGRAAREEAGIKVRQPLSRMICVAPNTHSPAYVRGLRELVPLLAAELNVKSVDFATSADSLVTLEAKPNFRTLGKKFGKHTPLAAQVVSGLPSTQLRAFESGTPLLVTVEGQSHQLTPEDLTIVRRASGEFAVQEDGGFFAAIDPAVTPELRREGLARELISRVQRMRKERGFAVSDRITLSVAAGREVREVLAAHGSWISDEVLATELVVVDDGLQPAQHHQDMAAVDLDGLEARVSITRNEEHGDI
jgi:isoleucyl-tRNA synthetase